MVIQMLIGQEILQQESRRQGPGISPPLRARNDQHTLSPCNCVFSGRAAEVKDDERDAVNMPDIAMPVVIQNTAKSLP